MHKAKVKDQEAKNALFRPDWTKVMNDTTIQKKMLLAAYYIYVCIYQYIFICALCVISRGVDVLRRGKKKSSSCYDCSG